MKRCPSCNRAYTDDTLRFCLEDGTPLTASESATQPTIVAPSMPPPTIAFDPSRPTVTQPQPQQTFGTGGWVPPPPKPKRKVWPWVVGGLVLLFILAGGLVGVLLALASLSSTSENSTPTPTPIASPKPSPSAEPTPEPTPATTEISGIHMARDRGDGEPGAEASKFSPSERVLHCVIQLSGNRAGTTITFKWVAVNAGDAKNSLLKEMEYVTKGQEPGVHADLTRHEDWAVGDWKVDVYVNGTFARSVAFTVE